MKFITSYMMRSVIYPRLLMFINNLSAYALFSEIISLNELAT